jgi:outer membrane protein assembly factor BamB
VELISPGAQQVLAYDPTTGEALWRVRYNGFSNVPRPLYGKGLVYVCTGYMKPQLWAIRPGGDGDATDSHVVWKFDRQVPANPSPIFVDDAVYMTSNNGILTCLDAETGQARWTERLGGAFSSSPIYGDGKLYFSSEEGVTTVVRPGPSFEKLAENLLDGTIMASPVASGDSIYLRTDRALYRISEADVVEVR